MYTQKFTESIFFNKENETKGPFFNERIINYKNKYVKNKENISLFFIYKKLNTKFKNVYKRMKNNNTI